MFNLDQAVAAWRQHMQQAGIKTPVPLDELEAHLRDALDVQLRLGLSPEQAFAVAVRQLGPADELKAEFERVSVPGDSWRQKWNSKWVGPFSLACISIYIVLSTRALLLTTSDFAERAIGMTALVELVLMSCLLWRLVPRFFPIQTSEIVESFVVMLFALFGMSWYIVVVFFLLPYFESSPGQVLDAILWGLTPVLGTPVFFLGVKNRSDMQARAIYLD